MVQQDRNIMALVYVLAHARSLRRKQRGIYPLVIYKKKRKEADRRDGAAHAPHAYKELAEKVV